MRWENYNDLGIIPGWKREYPENCRARNRYILRSWKNSRLGKKNIPETGTGIFTICKDLEKWCGCSP
jgi:hypothetical protein